MKEPNGFGRGEIFTRSMKGATAQLLHTAQLAGEQLQRNQPIGDLSKELYTKTQIFKKNLLFHYSLDISLLKHQRLEPQPHWQRSPPGEPCMLGKLRWEVQNRTMRLLRGEPSQKGCGCRETAGN